MRIDNAYPCPFCHRAGAAVSSRKTSGSGAEERYMAQVRCRKCHARGPGVFFSVEVKAGFPDLDEKNPASARCQAEYAAIERWNKTAAAIAGCETAERLRGKRKEKTPCP